MCSHATKYIVFTWEQIRTFKKFLKLPFRIFPPATRKQDPSEDEHVFLLYCLTFGTKQIYSFLPKNNTFYMNKDNGKKENRQMILQS